MKPTWREVSYKGLVEKTDRYKRERDIYLDDLISYREWFVMNEEKLKEVALTAPPYTKRNHEYLMTVIHAKYCPHTEE